MKTSPYWTDQTSPPEEVSSFDLPPKADVVVVGSGYTGLHAARVLADSGVNTVVLEQHSVGWGASSRNGGMLTPGLKAPIQKITSRYGLQLARQFWHWALAAIDHVERTIKEDQIDCDFNRPGHLYLAYKPSHAAKMKQNRDFLAEKMGYTAPRFVEAEALNSEIGSSAFYAGIVDETSASLDPAKYVFGLARAVAERNVPIVESAEVQSIKRASGAFTLVTNKGRISTSKVLLATNGYTGNLLPVARRGIFPVGSYVIVTEPLPVKLQAELSPKGRMFYDSKYFLNYFRLTPDGRMLFGGRNNFSTSLDLRQSAIQLHRRLCEVFPQLSQTPLTHSWTGKLGVTFDLMPHILHSDGIYVAYGYCGHGISIASHLGKEVGELISGQRSESPFLSITQPRYVFASLDRYYLPFVALWYQMLDKYT